VDPVPPEEADPASFLPRTAHNVEEMFGELTAMAAAIRQPHLKALLEAVLGDPEIAARFRRAPAAKSMHHACVGGLLEHVLSLARLCQGLAEHYPVNRDLLLAGAVLHDVGKIYELSYDGAFQYTTPGKLIGHIALGLELVREKIRALPDFPAELKMLIEHMILSHHGHLEFGSPVEPSFPEAVLLHYLDDLDSKMAAMRATPAAEQDQWTARCASLQRSLLVVDRFWKDEERR
jgi:3'-5' exoribonuclease